MELKPKTVIEMGRGGCPSGQIRRKRYVRKGYRRKDGARVARTVVPSGCVIDRGAPGKTPAARRFAKFPKKGPYIPGWTKDASDEKRHAAVARQARALSCRETWRRLHQLRNVTTDPETKRKATADRNWIRRQGWCPWKTPVGK